MPKASTNRMIYNANYNKVGQCIYNKDLWNRPLLDFEWNRFRICQYFEKTIIYAIQDVISLNCLFNYIFFTKLFFCVSENQECNDGLWKPIANKYSLNC